MPEQIGYHPPEINLFPASLPETRATLANTEVISGDEIKVEPLTQNDVFINRLDDDALDALASQMASMGISA